MKTIHTERLQLSRCAIPPKRAETLVRLTHLTQTWLLGYEFPSVLTHITKDKVIFVMSSGKGLQPALLCPLLLTCSVCSQIPYTSRKSTRRKARWVRQLAYYRNYRQSKGRSA